MLRIRFHVIIESSRQLQYEMKSSRKVYIDNLKSKKGGLRQPWSCIRLAYDASCSKHSTGRGAAVRRGGGALEPPLLGSSGMAEVNNNNNKNNINNN